MKFEKIVEFHSYDRFGEILYVLHKNNRKYLNNSLAEYDLNLLQAMCILILDEKSDITQQDLAELLFLTKSGITKAIRKLEQDGYIERKRSQHDGRQHVLYLTKKGKEIIPTLNSINKQWEEKMGLPDLGPEFLTILNDLATKSVKLNDEK